MIDQIEQTERAGLGWAKQMMFQCFNNKTGVNDVSAVGLERTLLLLSAYAQFSAAAQSAARVRQPAKRTYGGARRRKRSGTHLGCVFGSLAMVGPQERRAKSYPQGDGTKDFH